jgi:hypothetical protein
MLYHRVQAFLSDLIAKLDNQNLVSFLSLHDFPVEMTLDGVPLSATRPSELEAHMTELARAFKQSGIATREYTLMAVEVPRQGRFRIWVRSRYMNAAGEHVRTSDKIMHLRDKHGRLMVEEVHVHRRQLQEPLHWLPNAQRSA